MPLQPDRRLPLHPRSGWISLLLFQAVIFSFALLLVLAFGGLMPSVFPNTPAGQSKAFHIGILLSMPMAILGLIAGFAALVQTTRRRLLGVLGASLNGLHLLLCLAYFSR